MKSWLMHAQTLHQGVTNLHTDKCYKKKDSVTSILISYHEITVNNRQKVCAKRHEVSNFFDEQTWFPLDNDKRVSCELKVIRTKYVKLSCIDTDYGDFFVNYSAFSNVVSRDNKSHWFGARFLFNRYIGINIKQTSMFFAPSRKNN